MLYCLGIENIVLMYLYIREYIEALWSQHNSIVFRVWQYVYIYFLVTIYHISSSTPMKLNFFHCFISLIAFGIVNMIYSNTYPQPSLFSLWFSFSDIIVNAESPINPVRMMYTYYLLAIRQCVSHRLILGLYLRTI